MKSQRLHERHLDLRLVLDYVDQRLDAAGRAAVEEHLGRPCPACRERVRVAGELVQLMRSDRAGEVPAWLHERALGVFAPVADASASPRWTEVLAELVFDSLAAPLPAAARRSVGEARRLRYRIGAHAVELELEPEDRGTLGLRGRLHAPDSALWTLRLACGEERFERRPDAVGAFAFGGVPRGRLDLVLEAPDARFRLPPITS
ncbi:MAG TPA: hypothetical protein VMH61_08975 [Candidatus Acidoferrales bacterium]|nr:hypothetical protein [Candidatus Acidoferrales bacterium]